MNIKYGISFSMALLAALTACNREAANDTCNQAGDGLIETSIGLDLTDATRTSLADDGMTTRWSAGDNIALWARNASGDYTVEAARLSLRHFSSDYSTALFTGRIEAMEQGSYDYFMIYPTPTTTDGTLATYEIPSVQSGEYDAACDVMIASPVTADALPAGKTAQMTATMHHMMHAVKITIPENRNLFGERFTRLEMTFPYPVTGSVTYDVTNPDAAPQISAASNTLVIESAEGFDAGDTLWAFVLPSAATVEGEIGYMVRNERRYSESVAYDVALDMRRGHVTPIKMTIPSLYKYTSLEFAIAANNLGEEFERMNVYDASGALVATFTHNDSELYKMEYYGDFDHSDWSDTDFTLSFDSPHATVETTLNVGTIEPYSRHEFTTAVPYLFEETFDSIADFSDGHDNYATGGVNSDTYTSGIMLDSYGLAGWSGSRVGVGGTDGKSIRVCCRTQCTIFNQKYRYHGRLDSPRLSRLKSAVDVEVTIDYGANNAGSSAISPIAAYGYNNTTDGKIDSKQSDTGWAVSGATALPQLSLGGSFDSTPETLTYVIAGCDATYRLSWEVGSTGYANTTNANSWLYIDNIRVKIKPAQ